MHSKWLDFATEVAAFHYQSKRYDHYKPPSFGANPGVQSLEVRASEILFIDNSSNNNNRNDSNDDDDDDDDYEGLDLPTTTTTSAVCRSNMTKGTFSTATTTRRR